MSIALPIIQVSYNTGATLYAHLRDSDTGQVWNGTSFEAYNPAHWASYSVAIPEQSGSGVYVVARPAGVAAHLTSEAIYVQAGGSPAIGDAPPFILSNTGGVNVAAISGDASVSPSNLQAALSTETQGAVAAGVITSSSFPTNLVNANLGAYQGLTIRFVSGAAAGQAGLIANFTPTGGIITLSGSLAVAPALNDAFILV